LCTLHSQSIIHDTRSLVYHFYAEAVDRTVSEDSSPLAVALVKDAQETHTAAPYIAVALVKVAQETHTAAPYTGCVFLSSDTLKFAELLCY
jgi:hypothetical protein